MLTANLTATHADPNPGDLPTLVVSLGGEYAKLSFPCHPGRRIKPPPRGPIRAFTPAARRRLMDRTAQIDRTQVKRLPLFITLTYPACWPTSTAECKRHLDTFWKRLVRKYPNASAIWKLEYQARGAPHYHLLVWGVDFVPHTQVAFDWWQVVGTGDAAHLAAGTETKRVRSWRGVAYYAAKYLGKVGGEAPVGKPGRFWGVLNRAHLPTRLLVCYVAWRAAYRLRRVLWRRAASKGFPARRRAAWQGVRTYYAGERLLELVTATINQDSIATKLHTHVSPGDTPIERSATRRANLTHRPNWPV